MIRRTICEHEWPVMSPCPECGLDAAPLSPEWFWLMDYGNDTAFITDDPTWEQGVIAEGLTPKQARTIAKAHNASREPKDMRR